MQSRGSWTRPSPEALQTTPRYEPYTGDDPVGFVASSCVHRSLNASQRSLVAVGFLEYEQEQAKARMVTGGKEKGVAGLPHPNQDVGKSRDKAAERMGVGGATLTFLKRTKNPPQRVS